MKINKNLRRVVVTLVLIGAGFVYGKQTGEQKILNRWEIDGLSQIGMTLDLSKSFYMILNLKILGKN